MGRDNQPKARQLARLQHKEARRASYERILIVCEGSKTEPQYFEEICAAYHLHSANVQVYPSLLGTAPIQVVEYARQLFVRGDLHKGIRPRSFDQVYAVFDRDDHDSYFAALSHAASLDGKLRGDNGQPVTFRAIASVPNFELWLLLHFETIYEAIARDDVIQRLRQHIHDYDKGARGIFSVTREHLDEALQRAQALSERFTAYSAPEPYTDAANLVALLIALRGTRMT